MNLENLYTSIGSYDPNLDCLLPVYILYPQIPRYELIYNEEYFIPLVKKHFKETNELNAGDLLIFKLPNSFHFGIYACDGEFFHCCKKHKLRVSRLSGYRKYLIGQYRYEG